VAPDNTPKLLPLVPWRGMPATACRQVSNRDSTAASASAKSGSKLISSVPGGKPQQQQQQQQQHVSKCFQQTALGWNATKCVHVID
jgi:hypothetical protein